MSASAMNNTAAAGEGISSFGYSIAFSLGILFLIVAMTLASYCCARNNSTAYSPRPPDGHPEPPPEVPRDCAAFDEATLSSYPGMLFSEAKITNKDSTSACCSICLADYINSDMLRVLPDCGHLFHLKCVDPWLRCHPTCPVCRTTPVRTPSAEGVPPGARRIG